MSERTVAAAAGRLVAGIDSSTQSCKVELRDAVTGELRGTGAAPHQPVTPPKSEQNPADWWDALVLAFGRALEAASAGPGDIAAISVGAQCHGLVALDEDNQVIRPAKLWNDTTSTPELLELRAAIGDDQMIQRLGTLPTAAFTITKIAWLAAHEPENFAKVRHILLPHDYLTFRLTGAYVTDRSEASGTGYFDDAANVYLPEFLAHVGADRDWLPLLPTVLGPDDIAGTVHDEALAALGLTGEIVVGAGGGDQHIAALGLGTGLGDVVYSFGTSGVVSVLHNTDVHDPEGLVNGVADCAGEFMPLICTLNAAKVTDTFGRILGVDHAELAQLALSAPVDSIGPSLAAFLDGERTPNRPGASGIIAGITTETTREEIARAAYEGVIFGLVAGQKQLERLGVGTDGRIIAVGGGAKSPAYTQLLADALGRTILTADAPEATARGAAVQASAIATGRPVTEVRTLWAPATAVAAEPRPVTRDAWTAYEAVAAVSQLDRV